MSGENAEVIRGAVEAWNAPDMDRLRTFYDPDVVVRPLPDWPEAPREAIGGRDELMRVFAQIREPWDATDVLEILGDLVTASDRVIARYRWKAVGHGPPMSMEMTYVNEVRNGRIVEIEMFWDHAKALEAVGLSE
jgi:ketosteroid isomerase-like protein